MNTIIVDRFTTQKITLYYGEEYQINKLIEELLQLVSALHAHQTSISFKSTDQIRLLEQCANTFIQLDYIINYFDTDIINEFIKAKQQILFDNVNKLIQKNNRLVL